jgi:hypothetical protein
MTFVEFLDAYKTWIIGVAVAMALLRLPALELTPGFLLGYAIGSVLFALLAVGLGVGVRRGLERAAAAVRSSPE